MRINKYISETGIVSRREADKLVAAKRVTINGHLAELGSVVGPEDSVQLDGKPIGNKKQHIYIVLNKPVGITSTTERHVKGNIVDYVNHPERIFPIGRLDKDSEGLILLTNNGDIVNEILRAEHNHEKEYIVTVNGPVTTSFLKAMSSGVRILDTITKPCEVTRLGEREFRIILTQGLNRQIRRMCSTLGLNVVRLQRIRIMNIKLDGMKYGAWRNLSQQELNELRRLLSGQ
jgi:23S rRNA pseudouridine2604 synthase